MNDVDCYIIVDFLLQFLTRALSPPQRALTVGPATALG